MQRQITRKWYKIELFTMADQQRVAYGVSNGTIFNDLKQPLTQFSKSRHCFMPNTSETVRDTDVVTRNINRNLTPF